MIKIKIIALSKLKEKYLAEAQSEYLKRLSAHAAVEVIEIEPVRLPENPSNLEIAKALTAEAEAIKKKIPTQATVVAMCIEGKKLSSEAFAETMQNKINGGSGTFVYIIGSSFGLSPEIKAMADIKLSFSDMTFPHQLFRVMLLEQIYRAFKINEGSKYHK